MSKVTLQPNHSLPDYQAAHSGNSVSLKPAGLGNKVQLLPNMNRENHGVQLTPASSNLSKPSSAILTPNTSTPQQTHVDLRPRRSDGAGNSRVILKTNNQNDPPAVVPNRAPENRFISQGMVVKSNRTAISELRPIGAISPGSHGVGPSKPSPIYGQKKPPKRVESSEIQTAVRPPLHRHSPLQPVDSDVHHQGSKGLGKGTQNLFPVQSQNLRPSQKQIGVMAKASTKSLTVQLAPTFPGAAKLAVRKEEPPKLRREYGDNQMNVERRKPDDARREEYRAAARQQAKYFEVTQDNKSKGSRDDHSRGKTHESDDEDPYAYSYPVRQRRGREEHPVSYQLEGSTMAPQYKSGPQQKFPVAAYAPQYPPSQPAYPSHHNLVDASGRGQLERREEHFEQVKKRPSGGRDEQSEAKRVRSQQAQYDAGVMQVKLKKLRKATCGTQTVHFQWLPSIQREFLQPAPPPLTVAAVHESTTFPPALIFILKSLPELLECISSKLSSFDLLACVAAISQASQLKCDLEEPKLKPLLEKTLALIVGHGSTISGEVADLFEGLARMCLAKPSSSTRTLAEKLFLAAAELCLPQEGKGGHGILTQFSPQQLAQFAWGLARMELAHPRLLQMISRQASEKVSRFAPSDISNLTWSMAKMQFGSETLFYRFAPIIVSTASLFTASNLSNTMWAYAMVNVPDEKMMRALAKRSLEILPHLKPLELANTVWGLTKLNYRDDELYLLVCRQCLATGLDIFRPHEMVTLVLGITRVCWSMAAALRPGDLPVDAIRLLDCAGSCIVHNGNAYSLGQLRQVISCMAKINVEHKELFDYVTHRQINRESGGAQEKEEPKPMREVEEKSKRGWVREEPNVAGEELKGEERSKSKGHFGDAKGKRTISSEAYVKKSRDDDSRREGGEVHKQSKTKKLGQPWHEESAYIPPKPYDYQKVEDSGSRGGKRKVSYDDSPLLRKPNRWIPKGGALDVAKNFKDEPRAKGSPPSIPLEAQNYGQQARRDRSLEEGHRGFQRGRKSEEDKSRGEHQKTNEGSQAGRYGRYEEYVPRDRDVVGRKYGANRDAGQREGRDYARGSHGYGGYSKKLDYGEGERKGRDGGYKRGGRGYEREGREERGRYNERGEGGGRHREYPRRY